jgi:pimeloyl-ACP methyl ester carboxylesterase
VEALGLGPSVIVGHSWGGNVALQFAVDLPELTAGLVLVDGGFLEIASREGWTWERTERELAPPVLEGITREQMLERIRSGNLGGIWSPELAESVLGHFEHFPDGTIRPWLRREQHMQIVRAIWEHRPSRLWSRVQCPVLLVPARQLRAEGRSAEMLVAKEASVVLAERELARSRTLWMEETIHDVPLQRPRELGEAIRQLAREAR